MHAGDKYLLVIFKGSADPSQHRSSRPWRIHIEEVIIKSFGENDCDIEVAYVDDPGVTTYADKCDLFDTKYTTYFNSLQDFLRTAHA